MPGSVRSPSARLTGPGSPLRYAAAGLVNTGAGYAGILTAAAFGAAPVLANASGFALGFAVSLSLAGRWTFTEDRPRIGPRYLLCFLACYALNLGTMGAARALGLPDWVAQGVGIGTYAAVFYVAARVFVFGQGAALADDLRALLALTGKGSAAARGRRSPTAQARPSS